MDNKRFVCNGFGGGVAMGHGAMLVLSMVADRVRAEFLAQYPEARERRMNNRGVFCGGRFEDNDSLAARIEHVTDEADFLLHPVEWVRAAILDCAESDHWYAFEKEY